MERKTVSFAGHYATAEDGGWKEKFNVVRDEDGCTVIESKDMFQYQMGDKVINYRFAIDAFDGRAFDGDTDADTVASITLYMIPDARQWYSRHIKDYKYACGYEDIPDETVFATINAYDAIQNDSAIILGRDFVSYEFSEYPDGLIDVLEFGKAEEMVNAAVSCIPLFSEFMQKSLQCHQNRIGTTGEDKLDDIINGTDSISVALNRIKDN